MADEPVDPADHDPCADFSIRELPHLRRLRETCRKLGPPPEPAAGTILPPLATDGDIDFGLRRSTDEEAVAFLRELLAEDDSSDPMTEFLDDE